MSIQDYDYLFKLLIIGDSGVGKSSLLMRFSDNIFSGTYITTIGVDFKIRTLTVNGKRVKLQIWDTAGQERFRTITSTYYRGAQGVVIVYDVNASESFANVKRWITEADQYCDKTVSKILVGNKNDNPDAKMVEPKDARMVAEQYDIQFVESSAKDNINVDEMFQMIAVAVLKVKQRLEAENPSADKSRAAERVVVGGKSSSAGKKKCC